MRVGFVGLGKLGMPCAVAMASKGHDVIGYDIDPELMSKRPRRYHETAADGRSDFNACLAESTIRFGSLNEVARHAELMFVAVQTPHGPAFEGVTPLPEGRADFDYGFLVRAVTDIMACAHAPKVLVIVSTVLPGTLRRHVLPLLPPRVELAYNPYFIAMGTAMYDFLNPEFVLCGSDSPSVCDELRSFYRTITNAPLYATSVESAELAKVAYNTFIGMKIAFANTIMEVCHKVPGADADAVVGALQLATRRLISGKYLSGGMGDGGGCHPRDNIAMSWLARRLDLSFDWFESLMLARERQTEWLADLMEAHALPKAILGYSFKPESNITLGSPALLLRHILERRGHRVLLYDPLVEPDALDVSALGPMVFLIGAKHRVFESYRFPAGSVVIDPWRYLRGTPEVRVVSVGRQSPIGDAARCDAPPPTAAGDPRRGPSRWPRPAEPGALASPSDELRPS
jgi:UDPglucose 6-dehydrogenase